MYVCYYYYYYLIERGKTHLARRVNHPENPARSCIEAGGAITRRKRNTAKDVGALVEAISGK
jgi:hypothetical protein